MCAATRCVAAERRSNIEAYLRLYLHLSVSIVAFTPEGALCLISHESIYQHVRDKAREQDLASYLR
jgi:hypothetical protein